MVRVTPAQRRSAHRTLTALPNIDPRLRELIQLVLEEPCRGYTAAMHQTVADEIAVALANAGDPQLSDLFLRARVWALRSGRAWSHPDRRRWNPGGRASS